MSIKSIYDKGPEVSQYCSPPETTTGMQKPSLYFVCTTKIAESEQVVETLAKSCIKKDGSPVPQPLKTKIEKSAREYSTGQPPTKVLGTPEKHILVLREELWNAQEVRDFRKLEIRKLPEDGDKIKVDVSSAGKYSLVAQNVMNLCMKDSKNQVKTQPKSVDKD